MAAHERLIANISIVSPTLLQRLATVLPKDTSFKIYHLSTPPTRTSAIYSPPPNTRPDRTYCESHFLTVSIDTSAKANGSGSADVLVFAIEILIYSTAYDSTFFVSKADSTGYLHLLGFQKGTPSPLREISAAFLQHLVKQHQRPNIRSVISLFARAQDQYLFPGSVEYSGKHVLDDRGLVRWWCRVLDPLIDESKTIEQSSSSQWGAIKGYLAIPGLEAHEIRSYIPKETARKQSSWTIGHPLREISRHADDVPPRCLIPHYPDDPKSRYLDELDDEIKNGKDKGSGRWKSVQNVDQFWDMMAFRHECSAGRMVGFIWIVFTPETRPQATDAVIGDSHSSFTTNDSLTWDEAALVEIPNSSSIPVTPATSFTASSQMRPMSSPCKPDEDTEAPLPSQRSVKPHKNPTPKKKKKLTGPIIPRQPKIKTENNTSNSGLLERPEVTPYYVWLPAGRGQVLLDEAGYSRATELLLRLDFANLPLATSSSRRWINEVRSSASSSMSEAWGQTVTGTKTVPQANVSGKAGVATLDMGLMRKKRKADFEEPKDAPAAAGVNVLGSGMIRKKAKA